MGLLLAFIFGLAAGAALIFLAQRFRDGADGPMHESLGELRAMTESFGRRQEELGAQSLHLDRLLGRAGDRGQWGEMTLKRVVERAGLQEHIDFDVQVSAGDSDGAGRPDLVINLPSKACVPVDSKAVWDNYDRALKAAPEDQAALYAQHAKDVRASIRTLGARKYWELFPVAPRMVVLFMPSESALAAAINAAPDLFEDAASRRVVLATPTTLSALLEVIALGWHQAALSENTDEIRKLGAQLVKRLQAVTKDLSRASKNLDTAVRAHNNVVESFDGKILSSVRRMGELGVAGGTDSLSPTLSEVAVRVRTGDDEDTPDAASNV